LLAGRETALKSAGQQAVVAELSAEIDNIRLACSWASAHRQTPLQARSLQTLHWFYDFRSWFQEGEAVFRRAVRALETAPQGVEQTVALGRLLAHQGYFASRRGQLGPAQALLLRSLALLRPQADRRALGDTLLYLGI